MEPISEQQKPIEQQPKQISTEAPKGFLHKVRETMKDTAILFSPSGALALGFIKATGELGNDHDNQPESAKPTPTEASQSFLREQGQGLERREAEVEVIPPTFMPF